MTLKSPALFAAIAIATGAIPQSAFPARRIAARSDEDREAQIDAAQRKRARKSAKRLRDWTGSRA